jgi:predicted nuclease with TOPRIM domain
MKHLKKFDTKINEGEEYIKGMKGDMLHVDLVEKYAEDGRDEEYRSKFDEYKPKIKGFTETSGAYSIGDIIEITAGYNSDIRYTVEILGFDADGDIYLLWDSFWAPIRNEDVRSIKLIKKANETS